jgi:hypothetical protein
MLLQGLFADLQGFLEVPLFDVERSGLLGQVGGGGIQAPGLLDLPDSLFRVVVQGMNGGEHEMVSGPGGLLGTIRRCGGGGGPKGIDGASCRQKDHQGPEARLIKG